MAGIKHNSLSDIQNIKRLLTVYAPGFAFIKELVQNADDSGAKWLRLIWHPGLPEANHPLLRGPGLIALNNGPFNQEDKMGLMQMGLGSKGGNSNKIGKFGLGTKSIFHVAEAFFFFESSGDSSLRDILNPWSPSHHTDWDVVNDCDWLKMFQTCSCHITESPEWFAQWIPLRRSDSLDGVSAIMEGPQCFPGDNDKCPKELITPFENSSPKLEELLPLLRSLSQVEFYDFDTLRHRIHIDREQHSITHNEQTMPYGEAQYSDSSAAKEWREQPAWPSVYTMHPNGIEEKSPDKAVWSHASILTSSAHQRIHGRLKIFWSVFLPVGNKPYVEIELPNCSIDISLFLHGYFFLNDSRTEILGLSERFPTGNKNDPNGICLAWNKSLAETGLLPSVVKDLILKLKELRLSANQAEVTMKAFASSLITQSFSAQLCTNGSAVYRVTAAGGHYEWVPLTSPLYLIPCIEGEDDRLTLLSLLEGTNDNLESAVLAINSMQRPAVTHKHGTFGKNGMECLFSQVSSKLDHLQPQQAALLRRLLTSEPKENIPEIALEAKLFEVESSGGIEWLSMNEMSIAKLAGQLFRSSNKLQSLVPLLEKCFSDDQQLKFLKIYVRVPSELEPPNFTVQRAAEWLLKQDTLSEDLSARKALLKKFSSREQHSFPEKLAIRYLCHGNVSLRDDLTRHLYSSDKLKTNHWNDVFTVVLRSQRYEHLIIDKSLTDDLSPQLQKECKIRQCSREDWGKLLYDYHDHLAKINFSNTPSKTLEKVLSESRSSDFPQLKKLRIHSISERELVAAEDESVHLESELKVSRQHQAQWDAIRADQKVVKLSKDPHVSTRQKELFANRLLDKNTAIRMILEMVSNKEKHWPLLLDLLGEGEIVDEELIKLLKTTKWIPLGKSELNGWTSPNQLLNLKIPYKLTSKLLPASDRESGYSLVSQIFEEFTQQKRSNSTVWKTVSTQLLNTSKDSEIRLVDYLEQSEHTQYLGCVPISENHAETWLKLVRLEGTSKNFHNLEDFDELHIKHPEMTKRLIGILSKPLQTPDTETAALHYISIFKELRRLHESESEEKKANLLNIFSSYLKGAAASPCWFKVRSNPEFTLYSQSKTWVEASKLSRNCPNISPSALLSKSLSIVVQQVTTNIQSAEDASETNQNFVSGEDSYLSLKSGLDSLRHQIPQRLVGLLASLFANEKQSREYAELLLDGISIDSVFEELFPSSEMHNSDLSKRDYARRKILRATIHSGDTLQLESIAGTIFEAPLKANSDLLFMPYSDGRLVKWAGSTNDGKYLETISIAPLHFLDELSERQLKDKLRDTVEHLLKEAYGHTSRDLDTIIEKFTNAGQSSVDVAQQEILMSIGAHLQSLGAKPERMQDSLADIQDAHSMLAQSRSGIGNAKALKEQSDTLITSANAQLMNILGNCTETQLELVQGMRRKISQQQYDLDSIPFELLQNADDSLFELKEYAEESTSDSQQFVIDMDSDSIAFLHAGRPINAPAGATDRISARRRRDLMKMLQFSGSDKSIESSDQTTGKFGLGFKSIYKLAARPKIKSDNLYFTINGAIWPDSLDTTEINTLNERSNRWFPEHCKITAIVLESSDSEIIERSMNRFTQLIRWQTIFTREINSIVYNNGTRASYAWNPASVGSSPILYIGQLSPKETALELKSGGIQWVFSIKNGVLQPLPDDVPWLWVTTPTREKHCGFIVNGPFAVDPGRTRLSKQSEDISNANLPLFSQAATLFFEGFSSLVKQTEELTIQLKLNDHYAFWKSLWDIMVSLPELSEEHQDNEKEGAEHLAASLWQHPTSSGYAKLIHSSGVLPNGLTGELRELTCTSNLTHSLSGWLNKKNGARFFAEYDSESSSLSYCSEDVALHLRKHLKIKLTKLTLPLLLDKEMERNGGIKPKSLNLLLEHLIVPDKETSSVLDYLPFDDRIAISSKLDDWLFLSEDNSYIHSGLLLHSKSQHPASEESKRYKLAPESRRLSREYGQEAAEFIRSLRSDYEVTNKQLREWISLLEDDGYSAAITYLLETENQIGIAKELGQDWFKLLEASKAYNSLDENQRKMISIILEQVELEKAKTAASQGVILEQHDSPFEDDDDSIEIDDLLNCWDPEDALAQFSISGPLRKLVSPSSDSDKEVTALLQAPETEEGKSTWFRMLCLGCTLGIPRGKVPTKDVALLWGELLDEKFWNITTDQNAQTPNADVFSTELKDLFEKAIYKEFSSHNASGEYAEFWRRVFYDFRKMHTYVYQNDFPSLIIEFSKHPDATGAGLAKFLRSGQVQDTMRDDDHSRFIGVIGQSMQSPLFFIIRELRRLGVLSDQFSETAFYLNSPARTVAERIGWIDSTEYNSRLTTDSLCNLSQIVYDKMTSELPELLEFYDLPLQYYAHKNL